MRVTTLVSAASLLAVVCIFKSLFITRIYHITSRPQPLHLWFVRMLQLPNAQKIVSPMWTQLKWAVYQFRLWSWIIYSYPGSLFVPQVTLHVIVRIPWSLVTFVRACLQAAAYVCIFAHQSWSNANNSLNADWKCQQRNLLWRGSMCCQWCGCFYAWWRVVNDRLLFRHCWLHTILNVIILWINFVSQWDHFH